MLVGRKEGDGSVADATVGRKSESGKSRTAPDSSGTGGNVSLVRVKGGERTNGSSDG